MRYEWLIGFRYLRSTHRSGFVSFVASMSVIGLSLGVAVLIVVLSVLNGYESELRSRILSVTAHATITGLQGSIPQWRSLQERSAQQPGVKAVVPFIEARGLLAKGQGVAGALIRGILPEEESKAVGLASSLEQGELTDLEAGKFRIVLGSALAAEIGARVGDNIVLMTSEGSATPAGFMPRTRRFVVSGIFESRMYEFDRTLALVHLSDAAKLYRIGTNVTGLRFALEDPFNAPKRVRELAILIDDSGEGYFVTDWTRDHETLFRAVDLTRSMMFFLLLIIVIVAAVNLVATLVMIVKEKQTDIAILRTIGAAPGNVLEMFLVQGVLIGFVGTLVGVLLGWILSLNIESIIAGIESLFGVKFLDATVYFMSDLTAEVRLADVLRVSALALALSAVATLYPAWRASRTLPAEALRHE